MAFGIWEELENNAVVICAGSPTTFKIKRKLVPNKLSSCNPAEDVKCVHIIECL